MKPLALLFLVLLLHCTRISSRIDHFREVRRCYSTFLKTSIALIRLGLFDEILCEAHQCVSAPRPHVFELSGRNCTRLLETLIHLQCVSRTSREIEMPMWPPQNRALPGLAEYENLTSLHNRPKEDRRRSSLYLSRKLREAVKRR